MRREVILAAVLLVVVVAVYAGFAFYSNKVMFSPSVSVTRDVNMSGAGSRVELSISSEDNILFIHENIPEGCAVEGYSTSTEYGVLAYKPEEGTFVIMDNSKTISGTLDYTLSGRCLVENGSFSVDGENWEDVLQGSVVGNEEELPLQNSTSSEGNGTEQNNVNVTIENSTEQNNVTIGNDTGEVTENVSNATQTGCVGTFNFCSDMTLLDTQGTANKAPPCRMIGCTATYCVPTPSTPQMYASPNNGLPLCIFDDVALAPTGQPFSHNCSQVGYCIGNESYFLQFDYYMCAQHDGQWVSYNCAFALSGGLMGMACSDVLGGPNTHDCSFWGDSSQVDPGMVWKKDVCNNINGCKWKE